MTSAPVHSCCPSARIALHARRVRQPGDGDGDNAYRWYVGRVAETTVIFCPWCAVNLELDRRQRAAELAAAPPTDIRGRRKR
jgi:hypothetical protein